MTELISWLEQLKAFDEVNITDAAPCLEKLINQPPADIFGPVLTPVHSEALAYWFHVCQRLSGMYLHADKPDKAYSYLQFSYSKLQQLACLPQQDPAMKRWCLIKMDRMIVSMLEFCQHQPLPAWQQESNHLVDLHVRFMQANRPITLTSNPG